ncbi:MAG: deoxynucleoside kinase [Ectothiorhodospiraceae bacterium]|nr:deoxynucleoside kinase [Chromatiales bacterium]MCP5153872.1 deoxynucleoside kinase [Ectothiorhodospiraceae bacterium]
MESTGFSYVVVEGPIGVGKTTLARRLAAAWGADTLLEAPQDNPFLPRFYENQRAGALSTQLFFLLQRVRQVRELEQRDLFRSLVVADYLIEKDRLFAGLTLDADELALYEQLFVQLVATSVQPDLVIYLQAPVDVLLQRVATRGIDYELGIDADYLERLVAAYTRFFYHFEAAPLVIVNAAEVDFAHGDADFETLLDKLSSIRKGRHYLNPLPF